MAAPVTAMVSTMRPGDVLPGRLPSASPPSLPGGPSTLQRSQTNPVKDRQSDWGLSPSNYSGSLEIERKIESKVLPLIEPR